jgi:hypothetical protein
MAVLVRKKDAKYYQMVGGIGLSQADREQADRLDGLLEGKLKELIQDLSQRGLMPAEKGGGSLKTYWELGRVLRSVSESRDFPHKAELPLLWLNAKIYLPETLLYANRGPYREHLWYCYRLGGYPEALVTKMNWGEWVTVFDSTGINQEPRFDVWFQKKLGRLQSRLDRDWIRMFASCINEMLGNIDTVDLKDQELFNCYECAWNITDLWQAARKENPDYAVRRKEIQNAIISNLGMLDQLMEGKVKPKELAEYIMDTLPKSH